MPKAVVEFWGEIKTKKPHKVWYFYVKLNVTNTQKANKIVYLHTSVCNSKSLYTIAKVEFKFLTFHLSVCVNPSYARWHF